MLYNYIQAIDEGTIKPSPKVHKAMLTLFAKEISTVLNNPLVKANALADLLLVNSVWISNNTLKLALLTDETSAQAQKIIESSRAYIVEHSVDRVTWENLLNYLEEESYTLDEITKRRESDINIINGVPLYVPAEDTSIGE